MSERLATDRRRGAGLTAAPGSRIGTLLTLGLLVVAASACQEHPPDNGDTDGAWSGGRTEWGARGHLDAPAIDECSGIARSRRYPDVYWVHNDSGDTPRLFAIDGRGHLLGTFDIQGAAHVDWEDIAADDHGFLYVCDAGNNRNDRRDLTIYVVREPDPRQPGEIPIERQLRFEYPDQTAFPDPTMNHDCEAVIWLRDRLYLLTKHRSDLWTRLYRLDDLQTSDTQTLALIDSLEVGSMVTAADLSPDGSQLVVQTYEYLLLFDLPADSSGRSELLLSGGTARRLPFEGKQSEAVSHEGSVIRVINEQGEIHLLQCATVRKNSELFRAGDTGDEAEIASHARPAEPAATRAGYLPQRPRAELRPGQATPVELVWSGTEPHEVPGTEAHAELSCADGGLRIDLSWHAPFEESETTVMLLSWGPLSDRGLPGEADRVWEILYRPQGVSAECISGPDSAVPPRIDFARHGDRLEGSVVLPADTESSAGASRCRAPGALNLSLFTATGDEWFWGGDWSMRGAVNPFLWGELIVVTR